MKKVGKYTAESIILFFEVLFIAMNTVFLAGCTGSTSYGSNSSQPQITVIEYEEYPYYKNTVETYYDSDGFASTYTKEILFDCPERADEIFGCIVIHRDGESGQLSGDYKREPKDWQKDKCFATFTDQETGEIYYQLIQNSSSELIFDANSDYIVVPQNVFDKLTTKNG